jgi:hypothetical protein
MESNMALNFLFGKEGINQIIGKNNKGDKGASRATQAQAQGVQRLSDIHTSYQDHKQMAS